MRASLKGFFLKRSLNRGPRVVGVLKLGIVSHGVGFYGFLCKQLQDAGFRMLRSMSGYVWLVVCCLHPQFLPVNPRPEPQTQTLNPNRV